VRLRPLVAAPVTRPRHASRTALVCGLVAWLGLAGCGAGGTATSGDPALPQAPAATAAIRLIAVPGLGEVLADGTGHALYMFPPDAGGRVTCTGPCAGTWPPLAVEGRKDVRTTARVNPRLVGTLPDPNTGGQIVTYAGYPLYRYAGDVDGGTANGQALFANGGPWYVLTSDGQPVTTDPAAAR
jgi:predicted lipoprotein with Yx(FWY)xxD motif